MQRALLALLALMLVGLVATPLRAHFQVLLPTSDVVDSGKSLELTLLFTHPMQQGPVMEMGTPRQFGVLVDGQKLDLRDRLQEEKRDGKRAYRATVPLRRPGDYVFYLEPAPYWEASEDKMIVHYTKLVVDFLGGRVGLGPVGRAAGRD